MDAAAFVDKWRKSRRSGRSASQEHFLDLCEVLKHPRPGAVDPKGLRILSTRLGGVDAARPGLPQAIRAGIVAKSRPGKIEVIGSSEGRDLRSLSLRFPLPRSRSRHRCFFPSKILCFHQEMDACIC